MKKIILPLVFIVILSNGLYAQELEVQVSGGLEFAFGSFKVNSNYGYSSGTSSFPTYYSLNENTKSLFFAPGLVFSVRVVPNVDINASGFFFNGRAIFVTNGKTTGTESINNVSLNISEKYSIAKNDRLISLMEFDFGSSFKYKISEKLQLYYDLGINFTIMEDEDFETNDLLNYWGAGFYLGGALQVNLIKKMYLELGLNTIINALSSQKGEFYDSNRKFEYKDGGRWDLLTFAANIKIGWRIYK